AIAIYLCQRRKGYRKHIHQGKDCDQTDEDQDDIYDTVKHSILRSRHHMPSPHRLAMRLVVKIRTSPITDWNNPTADAKLKFICCKPVRNTQVSITSATGYTRMLYMM